MIIPLTTDLLDVFAEQRQRFKAKFGRKPGPNDPIVFDDNADSPQPDKEQIAELRAWVEVLVHERELHFRDFFAYHSRMSPPRPRLTPLEVIDRLITRLEQRVDALKRVKLHGFGPVIAELEEERHYRLRARDYLEG